MKKIIFLLIFVLFAFTSCKDDDDGDTSTTGTIIVNTNVPGHGAIAGVTVSLVVYDNDAYIQQKLSDANGKVVFENVLPDIYVIEADYIITDEEHLGSSGEFQLVAQQTKTINLSLD